MADIELRPVVRWFAERMELKLRANDHKGGWRECGIDYLFSRIAQERTELRRSVFGPHKRRLTTKERAEVTVDEAADVANFAMMIADIEWHESRDEDEDVRFLSAASEVAK